MRIVQISDTHVMARGGVPCRNLARAIEHIDGVLRPDLVVHTGDVVGLSPDFVPDRAAALRMLGTLRTPLRVLPGNHDVGEVGTRPWMGFRVTSERIAAHRHAFGDDRWEELRDGWALIGVNAQLLSTGLPEEDEQWAWLERVAARHRGRPSLLFVHKTPWPLLSDEALAEHPMSLDGRAGARLLRLLGDGLRGVASGHLHRYRQVGDGGPLEVWAPSTGFLAQSTDLPPAMERLGVVVWECDAEHVSVRFEAVPGLETVAASDIPEVRSAIAYIQRGVY